MNDEELKASLKVGDHVNVIYRPKFPGELPKIYRARVSVIQKSQFKDARGHAYRFSEIELCSDAEMQLVADQYKLRARANAVRDRVMQDLSLEQVAALEDALGINKSAKIEAVPGTLAALKSLTIIK